MKKMCKYDLKMLYKQKERLLKWQLEEKEERKEEERYKRLEKKLVLMSR